MQIKPGLPWKELPLGGVIDVPGSSVEFHTGDWRSSRPVIDLNKCTGCMLCWLNCPDNAIKIKNGKVEIDYDHCKGCGLCASVCPVKAISMRREALEEEERHGSKHKP